MEQLLLELQELQALEDKRNQRIAHIIAIGLINDGLFDDTETNPADLQDYTP